VATLGQLLKNWATFSQHLVTLQAGIVWYKKRKNICPIEMGSKRTHDVSAEKYKQNT